MLKLGKIVAIASALSFVFTTSVALASTPVSFNVDQANILSGSLGGGDNTALAEDWSFEYAYGNIGLNVASGNTNQQANMAFVDGGSPKFDFDGRVDQDIIGGGSAFSGYNDAHAKDSTFEHAYGNIGANIAAGGQNQQANNLFALENDTKVDAHYHQNQAFTLSIDTENNNASVEDDAFNYAHGNIGVNVASGAMNQQSNGAVVMTAAPDNDLNHINTSISQGNFANLNIASNSDFAAVKDCAFANAYGNIGVNVASGVGNQQANSLVVEP